MNVKVFLALSLVLLLGFAMTPSQAQETSNTPVAQLIQPGWTFSVSHEDSSSHTDNGTFTMVNDTNNMFLAMHTETHEHSDDSSGRSDMLVVDTIPVGNDPATEPAGVKTLENSTGTYGYEDQTTTTDTYYNPGTLQNETQSNNWGTPYTQQSYEDNNIEGFVPMNDTYFPLPEMFIWMMKGPNENDSGPAPAQNEDNGSMPLPLMWLFGNLSMVPPQMEIFSQTLENVLINGMYFTIDTTVVHFFLQAEYRDSGVYFDTDLNASMNYDIYGHVSMDLFIYYDNSNGLFIQFQSSFSTEINFHIDGVVLFSDINDDPNNPAPAWPVYITADFEIHDESESSASLDSISNLYTNGSTTTSETTGTNTTATNSTDTNSTSPPELPLPGFTLPTVIATLTSVMALTIIKRKRA